MSIEWTEIAKEHTILGEMPGILRDAAHQRSFDKGQLLYQRGQSPEAMLFVLRGEVCLVRHAQNGAECILQRVKTGFVAEASLDAHSYHCDVVGTHDGSLLAFPRVLFQTALDDEPAFYHAWSRLLAQEIRRLRAQNERLSLNSAAARILHYIESEGENGRIVLNQTRKAWAAELGLSHEVLYRTLRRLREKGEILINERQIALATQDTVKKTGIRGSCTRADVKP
ncbi:Crp/Fnr family transcriptional regulator [Thiolapillus sp.]